MSFTLKRGLSDIFVAEVTEDTVESFVTGTPRKLIPAGELSVTVENDSANYYFDNSVFDTVGREGNSEASITGAGLRPADIAAITGKEVDPDTGAVIDSGVFGAAKYFALGARMGNTDGTEELFWFMKGTFAIPDSSSKTKGEDTDATGTELTYSAIPTIHEFTKTKKPCKRVVIDTESTEIVADGDWFKQVVTPDNLSTVVKKKAAAAAQ